ncbi:MAG: hypothetical protein QW367_01915 [Candidatus Aenigmatarchaeota archaeon]
MRNKEPKGGFQAGRGGKGIEINVFSEGKNQRFVVKGEKDSLEGFMKLSKAAGNFPWDPIWRIIERILAIFWKQ